MWNPLRQAKEDIGFLIFAAKVAFIDPKSQRSPYQLRQQLERKLDKTKQPGFQQRYLFRKNEYRASLEKDHEPEEVEEQMLAADKMIRLKAKLDLWQIDDPSLDDIVSVGKHVQKAKDDSPTEKSFRKLDDSHSLSMTILRVGLYALAIATALHFLMKVAQ